MEKLEQKMLRFPNCNAKHGASLSCSATIRHLELGRNPRNPYSFILNVNRTYNIYMKL